MIPEVSGGAGGAVGAPRPRASSTGGLCGRRVLVTGAGGFIGSHLAERLVRDGAVVAGLCRRRGRLDQIADAGAVAFFQVDLSDPAACERALASFAPEVVFHYASLPDARESFEHAATSIEVNLRGTLNLLEAFRRCAGRVLVYGDSCKVYGNGPVPYSQATPPQPNSSYAISKLGAWQLCRLHAELHGFTAVSVRPTLIHGPRQGHNLLTMVVEAVRRGQPEIQLAGGAQTRDPLHVDDAINAILAAAQAGASLSGREVNIGGGQEVAVRDLAEMVVELAGGSQRVVCCTALARPTEMWRSWCDNADAERLIGWRPSLSLREGVRRTVEYLLHSLPAPTTMQSRN